MNKLVNEHHLPIGIVTADFNFIGNVNPLLFVQEVISGQAMSRVKELNYKVIGSTSIFFKTLSLSLRIFFNCERRTPTLTFSGNVPHFLRKLFVEEV